MKNLKELLPNASQSLLDANPDLSATMTLPANQTQELGQQGGKDSILEWEHKTEKDLHKSIRHQLLYRGIEFFESRMDKRTTQRKGTPDFVFAVEGRAIAWECKSPVGKLSKAQEEMHIRLEQWPNYWKIKVIRSLQEAIKELAELKL
jgi:hypothetical protein